MKYYCVHSVLLEEFTLDLITPSKTDGMPFIKSLSCLPPYEMARIMCYGKSRNRDLADTCTHTNIQTEPCHFLSVLCARAGDCLCELLSLFHEIPKLSIWPPLKDHFKNGRKQE